MEQSPDIFSILKKLEYREWPHRPVEKFFLVPLLTSFNTLRANLAKLYTMGFEFWKLPLGENKIFLKDVIVMCKHERVAERILGNHMLRSQVQFFYECFLEIFKTEGIRDLLLSKDERLLKYFIPRLVIFRALLHLNKVIDSKFDQMQLQKNSSSKSRIYQNVDDQLIGFGKFSAKEGRFEIPLSKQNYMINISFSKIT